MSRRVSAARKYVLECRKWHAAHSGEIRKRRPWTGFYPVPPCFIFE